MQRSEIINYYGYEWVERVSKTAYDLAHNRIDNDYIVKSSDPGLLGYIELAIEQHLEAMPSKLRPIFEQMLDDIKARKENLELL